MNKELGTATVLRDHKLEMAFYEIFFLNFLSRV